MKLTGGNLGIDLGTCNTLIYTAHKGIVYNEPTLVVNEAGKRRAAIAMGEDAREKLSHGTSGIIAVHPIREGVITDFDSTAGYIAYATRRAIGSSYFGKPRLFLSCPGCISAIDRRALSQAAAAVAGVTRKESNKRTHLIEKSFLAALGCGLPVFDIQGQMIVDIGGGTTDVAVISMGGIVVRHSVRVGGTKMDESIVNYVKQKYHLIIGQRTAEAVKIDLGSALEQTNVRSVRVRGIDVVSQLLQQTEINSTEVYDAIHMPCMAIVEAIKWVLERTPPDLVVDIMEQGISLTGGGSLLFGMDQFISNQLGVGVRQAKDCMESTARGLGSVVENYEKLKEQHLLGFDQ